MTDAREIAYRAACISRDSGTPIRRTFAAQVEPNAAARVLSFTISTASVDRMGDTIDQAGWELAAYRKNPLVLWMHDHTALPIGRALGVHVIGDAMRASVEFTPPELNGFGDCVYKMLKDGFLSATSVGFLPIKFAMPKSPQRFGIDFIEQELLEFSIVTVPANADALIEGRGASQSGTSLAIARARLDLRKAAIA